MPSQPSKGARLGVVLAASLASEDANFRLPTPGRDWRISHRDSVMDLELAALPWEPQWENV